MGQFTQFVKGAIKSLNPFSHSFGLNNNLAVCEEIFCRILTRVLFKRLIIDVFTKLGYKDEKQQRWIETNFFIFNQDGAQLRNIIWYLADTIATGSKVYLVYNGGIEDLKFPLRLATPQEEMEMDEILTQNGQLPQGKYIFNGWGYEEAKLVNLANSSLYQLVKTNQMQMKVASAPLIKAKDLTRNITFMDKEIAVEQGRSIRDGIQQGIGSIIDAESDVILLEPKTEAASQAFDNYTKMVSLYMGVPQAWVVGLLTSGSLNGGESDNNAIERGLKTNKLQIIDPILDNVFGIYIPFKKDSWRYLYKMQSILAWIEGSTILTNEEKNKYIRQILP